MRRIFIALGATALAMVGTAAYLAKASSQVTSVAPVPPPFHLTKLKDTDVVFPGNKGKQATFKVHKVEDLNLSDKAKKHLVKSELKDFGSVALGNVKDVDPTRQVFITEEKYYGSDGDSFQVMGHTFPKGTRTVITDAETGNILGVKMDYPREYAAALHPGGDPKAKP